MHLTERDLANRKRWEDAGYLLPAFDRKAMQERTRQMPRWVHFGAGNIFRAFIACVQQHVLNAGETDTGIIVAEGYDAEIIHKAYRPMDNYCLAVTLKADGSIQKEVVGSIAESLGMDRGSGDWERLREIFRSPSLEMASFTITEKGYQIRGADGAVLPGPAADFQAGPDGAESYIGRITALAYERFQAGRLPIAFVSMDNCSHNGTKLWEAVEAFAKAWVENKLVPEDFLAYITDRNLVGFPWSMIDKITPRPDDKVKHMLEADGLEDVESVVTSKGTYVAPFVNAEETEYLVIEDWFPNGRPPLDKGGVIFTDRETVDKVEKMKVCTCLNPLHTALAIYGCLLGYDRISAEMKDPDLVAMIRILGYREALPVVVNPGILDPKAFIDTVINVRLPNVFMPDTPQRIATDTSQKLSIRFGETIKAYLADPELDVQSLRILPLVLAGWCRYLMGVDDRGEPFRLSDDPMLPQLEPIFRQFSLGGACGVSEKLHPLLSNAAVFGVDLYEAGLGDRVEAYFQELCAGPGAVRATLHKYVAN